MSKGSVASTQSSPGLPSLPKTYKLFERSRVGHRQIKTSGNIFIRAVLAFSAFPGVLDSKIFIGWKIGFVFGHELQTVDAGNCLQKISDCPGDLKNYDAIRR